MMWCGILTLGVWAGVCSAYGTDAVANATIIINKAATCEPGTAWWDDCNACRCAPDRTTRCTKINCLEYRNGQTLNDMPPSRDDTQWQQEPCQCPDGSFRRCLKAGCPTVTPGQSTVKIPFYPGRRHCWCQNSFYSLCMTRRCAVTTSAPPPPPGNLRRTRCTPGLAFQNECNTCRCNVDGTSATCSDFKCAKKNEDKRRIWVTCVPGNVFRTRCHTCHCEDSGKIAVCTSTSCDTIN